MAHLSGWLEDHGLDCSELSASVVEAFVLDRRGAGHRDARSVRSLQPVLEYLREDAGIPQPARRPPTDPVEAVLVDYGRYLTRERGVVAATVRRSTDLVRPFLCAQRVGDSLDLTALTAAEITAFMLARSRSSSPATVQNTGSALRSLLRFMHWNGMVDSWLVGAVPSAANWRLAGLPKYLAPEKVAVLLASCDPETGVGRRDAAILRLLARLGLRAGEVARLTLDDIDWRRGEITVRGKGNRHERLPLPAEVGEVVVTYLSGSRPTSATCREVFVGIRAPHRALTRGAVTQTVARASRRCGLETVYAHRLRHSAATAMLHAGASLEEIGQVLRHQRAVTTANYAKVDYDGLRSLARPWPGVVA
jgi:site-specific recombinase XerD